jgi:hypothetical protein
MRRERRQRVARKSAVDNFSAPLSHVVNKVCLGNDRILSWLKLEVTWFAKLLARQIASELFVYSYFLQLLLCCFCLIESNAIFSRALIKC